MPVYNVENYIGESIQSVINQKYPNFELLIINDGSTDHTLDVINTFADKRIKVINQENSGVSIARNVGIDNANGEYISFLDGDDIYEPEFLELMIGNITGDIIYCGCYNFWDNGKIKHRNKKYMKGNILDPFILNIIGIHINSFLIKHESLKKSGIIFTSGCKFGEDFEFMAKLFCMFNCEYVPQELMGYRQARNDSACNNPLNDYSNKTDEINELKRMLKFIKQNYQKQNRSKVISNLLNKLYFVTYKAILVAIREKKYVEADKLLNENIVDLSNRTIKHKLRWKLINTRSKLIWRLLSIHKK